MLASLHLLIGEDFFQGPGQKHALCFVLLRLFMQRSRLLHVSVLIPPAFQAIIAGWSCEFVSTDESHSKLGYCCLPGSCYLILTPPCWVDVTSRDAQLSGAWRARLTWRHEPTFSRCRQWRSSTTAALQPAKFTAKSILSDKCSFLWKRIHISSELLKHFYYALQYTLLKINMKITVSIVILYIITYLASKNPYLII